MSDFSSSYVLNVNITCRIYCKRGLDMCFIIVVSEIIRILSVNNLYAY